MRRNLFAAVFLAYVLSGFVWAQSVVDTIGGINNVLYGVAAGIAALMIIFHAIRWKTAGSPADREAAKRGMINVVLGLVLIVVAAALVSMIYQVPEEAQSLVLFPFFRPCGVLSRRK